MEGGIGHVGGTGLVGGGKVGRGVSIALWESRRSMAVLRASQRAEQSYITKSMLVVAMLMYISLVVSMSRMSFFLIAVRNLLVKDLMRWLRGGGGGNSSAVGETWTASLLLSSSSRFRTWLVGVYVL